MTMKYINIRNIKDGVTTALESYFHNIDIKKYYKAKIVEKPKDEFDGYCINLSTQENEESYLDIYLNYDDCEDYESIEIKFNDIHNNGVVFEVYKDEFEDKNEKQIINLILSNIIETINEYYER